MTFSTEIQLFLKAEFGLVSNVCNILGHLEMPTGSLTKFVSREDF